MDSSQSDSTYKMFEWGDNMRLNTHIGNVDVHIDTKRIDNNIRTAQRLLNMQIAADCDPYIPFQQGALAGSVHYPQGIAGGEIAWGGTAYDVPYAHYVYRAEIYGPNIPIYDDEGNLTGYWSPPNKKPTGREMKFSKFHHPQATKEFFEAAKKDHKDEWIKKVKEIAGQD